VDVEGKAALVIGKATAEALADRGARVCVVDFNEQGAKDVAAAVGGTHVAADVGDVAQNDAAFAHCAAELGGVDIAYLNAGIAIGHPDLATLPDDEYRRIMRVNVDGVVYGLRAAIRAMRERGEGAIVATASLAGLIPFPPDPVYDLTKHAVVGLIRSVAPTLAGEHITANCVNPGMTDTNILTEDAKRMFAEAQFPLMPASQIAEAVVHAITSGETGRCWVCQPGREPTAYEFRNVPGPRSQEAEGRLPPSVEDWASQ
jgi:NAD(P)-dependent dehydrogenase (short-subunit alcohol dehydrogenase family)